MAGSSFPSCQARPKSSSRIESKRPSAAASWAIARFTSPISDAARFAGRHRPYLVGSTKFSRASKMHNRMLNSLGLFSLVYRLQLWSIRGTIHLENDDGFGNPRALFRRKGPVPRETALPLQARRIKNACSMLAAGKRRVCCFDRSGFYSKSMSAPKSAT
jgi:hypothetical protein